MKFAAAYEESRDAVYGYLVYMTKDTTLAEDLSQEVFLRMFLHLDKFRGEASVRTWALRIARNVFLSYARRKRPLLLEEQEAGMEWYKNAESPFVGTDMISMYFPEKYGHSYSFSLRLHEGHVYLWRGYSGDNLEVTFFEDNGVTEWFQEHIGELAE